MEIISVCITCLLSPPPFLVLSAWRVESSYSSESSYMNRVSIERVRRRRRDIIFGTRFIWIFHISGSMEVECCENICKWGHSVTGFNPTVVSTEDTMHLRGPPCSVFLSHVWDPHICSILCTSLSLKIKFDLVQNWSCTCMYLLKKSYNTYDQWRI